LHSLANPILRATVQKVDFDQNVRFAKFSIAAMRRLADMIQKNRRKHDPDDFEVRPISLLDFRARPRLTQPHIRHQSFLKTRPKPDPPPHSMTPEYLSPPKPTVGSLLSSAARRLDGRPLGRDSVIRTPPSSRERSSTPLCKASSNTPMLTPSKGPPATFCVALIGFFCSVAALPSTIVCSVLSS
jgi:hypothetical protein